jgi:TolA-binding protein
MDDNQNTQVEQKAEVSEVVVNNDAVKPSDALTPEHPRFKEVIKERNELREQIESLRSEINQIKNNSINNSGESGLSAEEEKAIALLEKELARRGFARIDDVKANSNAEKRAIKLETLGEKYNGSNGLPAFDSVEVISYAKENGFGDNYEQAYKSMHFDAIVSHEAKKRSSVNPPSSERPSGGDRSFETGLSVDHIKSMSPAEYEKSRLDILRKLRGR